MILESRSLENITEKALDVLFRELGAADAIRFLTQFSTDRGDYTAMREQLFAGLTLEQFFAEVKGTTKVETPGSGSP